MVQTRSQLKRSLQSGAVDASNSKITESIDKDVKLDRTNAKDNLNQNKETPKFNTQASLSNSEESYISESPNSENLLNYSSESDCSLETESKSVENLFKKSLFQSSLEASSPDTPFGPYPFDLEPFEPAFKKATVQPSYPPELKVFHSFDRQFNGNNFRYDSESSESIPQTESSLNPSESSNYQRQEARKFSKENNYFTS